ncbi:lactate utilization protein [Aestuariivirga litoralis]|uniref:Lactate utilization protein n=1 Tax=Aestuariivirga litoralis TaxID=2650924 RepID=A0A2W2B970_9HYPH|nr:lactate utilization protein [Aestuariivirga litoralis]PZF76628.1 lactate utilization protein [Aestuariivirga litoralis]
MSAREMILGRVRARIPRGPEGARREAVERRLAEHPRNLIPQRGQGDIEHRIRVFTEMMLAVGGTVEVIDDINEVPHHVAVYLRDGNLPARVRRGADPLLARLPWHRGGTLEVVEGPAVDEDRASVTHAFAGIAESGTIVQISGADNPTTLNFLPEAHIVVLESAALFASYEEAWTKLRSLMGEGIMPRTVNMISGPSRTADIEQTIVRPAHGPKNMHVIIVR